MTVADCARAATAVLERSGAAAPDGRRDVAVLVRHLLGWDAAAWLTRQATEVPADFPARLDALVHRRAEGEPIAYLTGEREFYGRPFAVTRDVLIPRPETEIVVEAAFAHLDRWSESSLHVLDVGTGSGCLAVTLAAERARVTVTATDVSPAALQIARANAARHAVTSRVRFEEASLCGTARDVALVVSNPPYVARRDGGSLMRDVRDFEPALALFGGDDGLDVIRALAPAARAALAPGGALVMEIGDGQAPDAERIVRAAGFAVVRTHRDLAGIVRVIDAARDSV